MDTRSRIKARTHRGEAAVWEYLDTCGVSAIFHQDPAARGLRAVLSYGQDQWNGGVLRTSSVFRSEAETFITTLFSDVLHYWARRNPNTFDMLQRRIWELRGEFEKFDFDRFVHEEELAALSPSGVSEVTARLLADLLLCAERLNLSSNDVFANGVRFFVADWNQLKFEQLPGAEQEARIVLATLEEQKLIVGFRPHGDEGDGMWHVQENQLDRTVLRTEDVAAYAERRNELLRPRPERPGSAWSDSSPR
ncbi:hypothetical protein [Streptomyces stelliscabiei]|uniref:hypothetical protein n=1 Tax=Streptomyces stelliscabiei TaxID=146820 RepID=UPI0029A61C6A|nr:hypothetical protein [Streptomyces stelliscabiei]MDX3435672.1 hypothetical protein [Streptomyces stelliscabiei]MDX3622029.1 hypothetical protein [Streptomyces stelliscabiei]